MKVYDPFAHSFVDTDNATCAEEVDAFLPVQSEVGGAWFVVHTPTSRSLRMEFINPDLYPRISESVTKHMAAINIPMRAMWILEHDVPPPISRDRFTRIIADANDTYGEPVGQSISTLLAMGMPDSVVAEAVVTAPSDRVFFDTLSTDDVYTSDSVLSIDESIYDDNLLKAVFLAGAGGSGKSSVADEMFSGTGMKVISQDKHLERFLKAANVPFSQAGTRYDLLTKSRDLKDKELNHYARSRLGLIIDSTGWDFERIFKPVQKLRALGYDVYMVFVTTSLKKALERNIRRGQEGGRDVPDSYIEDAWRGAHRNAKKYRQLFGKGKFFAVDNDKDLQANEWEKVLSPIIHRISKRILTNQIHNSKGVEWLKQRGIEQEAPSKPLDDIPSPELPEVPNAPPTYWKTNVGGLFGGSFIANQIASGSKNPEDAVGETENTPFVGKLREQAEIFRNRLHVPGVEIVFVDDARASEISEVCKEQIKVNNANDHTYRVNRFGVTLPHTVHVVAESVAHAAMLKYNELAKFDVRHLGVYAAAPKAFGRGYPEICKSIEATLSKIGDGK